MTRISAFIATLALGACATAPLVHDPIRTDGHAMLGQSTRVGALVVTPRAVLEDSRCPTTVQCIWAGRVVVRTQIDGAGWRDTRDLVLGEPQAVREHRVALTSVQPGKQGGAQVPPTAYLFGFEGGHGR